jgi:hypothetical protein
MFRGRDGGEAFGCSGPQMDLTCSALVFERKCGSSSHFGRDVAENVTSSLGWTGQVVACLRWFLGAQPHSAQ